MLQNVIIFKFSKNVPQPKRSGYDFDWVNHLDLDYGQGIVAFEVMSYDLKPSLYPIPLRENPRRWQSLAGPNLFRRPSFYRPLWPDRVVLIPEDVKSHLKGSHVWEEKP